MAGCFTPGVCVWLHYLIDLVGVQSVCNFTWCVFLCMCESVSMTVLHLKYDIYFVLNLNEREREIVRERERLFGCVINPP